MVLWDRGERYFLSHLAFLMAPGLPCKWGGRRNESVDFPQTVAKWSVTLWHLFKVGRVSGQKLPRIPTAVKEGQTSDGDFRAGWLREWRPRLLLLSIP